MITAALIVDTFREALARKIFWGLFALSLLMILFFLFVMRIDVVEGATATISLFGQTADKTNVGVDKLVPQIHGAIAAFLYSFGMFLAIFASAGLIPSVLEPGRIELVLSKPVSRAHLLAGRFLGNLLVVGINLTLLVTGIWLIFGWKTGFWNVPFLLTIPLTLFIFAVMLTVVTLIGVIWESTALSVMVPVFLMILSPVLAQDKVVRKLLDSEWSRDLWHALYYALPKVFDTGRIILQVVTGKGAGMGAFEWWPIWTSAAFAIVVYGTAQWVFSRRDF
jgi:ABC-type transport system involved in multi-copper enzyme maturation permease subunit